MRGVWWDVVFRRWLPRAAAGAKAGPAPRAGVGVCLAFVAAAAIARSARWMCLIHAWSMVGCCVPTLAAPGGGGGLDVARSTLTTAGFCFLGFLDVCDCIQQSSRIALLFALVLGHVALTRGLVGREHKRRASCQAARSSTAARAHPRILK